MNFTAELLNTSNLILSEYWEDTDAGSAAYGLSTFVNNQRFPHYKQEIIKNFACFHYHSKTLILHILLLGYDISLNPGPIKLSKGAKIRNRYNQVPHLAQDTNGKVTNSQLDTTNESQEVSPSCWKCAKSVRSNQDAAQFEDCDVYMYAT